MPSKQTVMKKPKDTKGALETIAARKTEEL